MKILDDLVFVATVMVLCSIIFSVMNFGDIPVYNIGLCVISLLISVEYERNRRLQKRGYNRSRFFDGWIVISVTIALVGYIAFMIVFLKSTYNGEYEEMVAVLAIVIVQYVITICVKYRSNRSSWRDIK